MKLFLLLLSLLAMASPAEARHHRHAQQHHAVVPLPQPRPVQRLEFDLDALGARLFSQLQPEWRQTSPDNTRRIGLQILALSMVTR